MAFEILRSGERGHFDHGWLDTRHTFSFGEYHDPSRMGFRSLRVMNEDRIGPGRGFGSHPHRDMEILTYVLEGTLRHHDSLGNGGPIHAGELQRMTAGSGIVHGEANGSDTEPVHLYQIWIFPDRKGLPPGYEQRSFDPSGRLGHWQVVASVDGRDGSLTIHQDATVALARLGPGVSIEPGIGPGRHGWIQILRGGVEAGGESLGPGDGAWFAGGEAPNLLGRSEAEILRFDLA